MIARPIGSMVEFKQIIGRGTRLYPDKDKTEFEIIDFVGATDKFRDPEFDGPPLKPAIDEMVSPDGDVNDSFARDRPDATVESPDSIAVAEPEAAYLPGGASDGAPALTDRERRDAALVDISRRTSAFADGELVEG